MRKYLFTIAFSLMASYAYSQPNFPEDGVPIDGGLSILLAAGVGYGAKKMYESRKDK
jgi:hypothetical protein